MAVEKLANLLVLIMLIADYHLHNILVDNLGSDGHDEKRSQPLIMSPSPT